MSDYSTIPSGPWSDVPITIPDSELISDPELILGPETIHTIETIVPEPIHGPKNIFTFEWRIFKFGNWNEVTPSYYIQSPRFHAMSLDSGMWLLKLFPRGRFEGDPHIGLTLESLSNTDSSINVNCEWFTLGSDGSPVDTVILKNQSIYGGCVLHMPHGPTSNQVFVTQRTAFLPKGNLTLQFRIWGTKWNLPRNEYISGQTQVHIKKDCFNWCINRFSHLPLMEPRETLSGFNLAPELKYPVVTNLTLTGESLESSIVRFDIILKGIVCPLWIKVKLKVLDSDLKEKTAFNKSRIFKPMGTQESMQMWRIEKLVSRQQILMKCLRDDVLTIRFKLYLIPQYASYVESTRRDEEIKDKSTPHGLPARDELVRSSGSADLSPKHSNSLTELSEDLRALFENPKMCDFELRSGEASFPAHKVVLNARSPVFSDMFSLGETTNYMDVPDVDPRTLDMLMSFLYTGIVADLQWESAIKLYYAANKFEVPSLKRECWKVLRTNINVRNVLQVLELADRIEDTELISFARDFFMEHLDSFIHSNEREEFFVQHPYLVGNTLSEIYKKKFEEPRSLSD